MKTTKFKNEDPLAKIQHLIKHLKNNTILIQKVNKINQLLQIGHSFTSKELLDIRVSKFEYQYPFYCKITSDNQVKKSILTKKDTLINHIKREARLNNCIIHYNRIQYFENHKAALDTVTTTTYLKIPSKLTEIKTTKNPKVPAEYENTANTLLVYFTSFIILIFEIIKSILKLAELFFPATATLLIVVWIWLLIALDSELFNTIFWTVIGVLFSCFCFCLLAAYMDDRNLKKLEKAKKRQEIELKKVRKLQEIELEKTFKIKKEKLLNLNHLKLIEIQLLKSKLRRRY